MFKHRTPYEPNGFDMLSTGRIVYFIIKNLRVAWQLNQSIS